MRPDWTPLDDEFALWDAAGMALPIWWRDDDATAPSAALDRLSDLAATLDLPVHLAVIPAGAGTALGERLRDRAHLIVLVHGWAHLNHAPAGEKKAEFGAHRPLAAMIGEAGRGLARLGDLFGPRLAPVLVPPWNRIAPELIPALPGLGYLALSDFTPRKAALAAPGLARINTHLDPIAWRGGRGLVAPDILIAQITRQLAGRRLGRADNTEPYGILTHHLVHDDTIWAFTEALLRRLLAGPGRRWNARHLTARKETDP